MTKTTKTTKAVSKADETRAAAEKAIAEKRKAVRGTALYGKIKDAVGKAIDEAAADGRDGIAIPPVKIPGELGSPDGTVGETLCSCENTALVADTLAEKTAALLDACGSEDEFRLRCAAANEDPEEVFKPYGQYVALARGMTEMGIPVKFGLSDWWAFEKIPGAKKPNPWLAGYVDSLR